MCIKNTAHVVKTHILTKGSGTWISMNTLTAVRLIKSHCWNQSQTHLAGCMDIELWFSKRCIRFLNMAMESYNVVVRTIINMGIEGFHSVMGRNLRLMQSKFKMDESSVLNFRIINVIMRVILLDRVFKLESFEGGEISVTVHFLTR